MTTNIKQLKQADWHEIERSVVLRIHTLKGLVRMMKEDDLGDKIALQLVLPALALLADFNTRIEISDE